MQPSNLDKIVPLSQNHPAKQHRVTANQVPHRLNAVSKPTPKPFYAVDKPRPEAATSDKTWTSKKPEADATSQGEKSFDDQSTHVANGKTPDVTPDATASGSGNEAKTTIGAEQTEEVEEQGFLPVLKNSNFLALWCGQVFCQMADKVYLVLMIALIETQFDRGDRTISAWVSALMMSFTIPAVLFGSVAGVFVDRWSKKAVLVVTNILRGVLVLVIPPLLWLTHDWTTVGMLPVGFGIILAVTFLVSTLTQFFAPAEQAVIPLVVKDRHLLSANSLYTTTMMASVIVGFAVGEPVLAIADTLWQQIGGSTGLGKELIVGGAYAIAGL